MRAAGDALFVSGDPAGADLRKMDAMHRAAMETMRIHSVAPLVVRTATNSFAFAGHRNLAAATTASLAPARCPSTAAAMAVPV